MSLIDDYVRDVLSRLPVAQKDRERIEADLRDHLNASVEAGLSESDAVSRMGPPSEVAAELMSNLTPLYAPPASRLGAMIFDIILVYALSFLLGAGAIVTFVGSFGDAGGESIAPFLLIALTFASLSLLPLCYFVFSEWLTGRTLGKLLFGVTVRDEKGHAPSFASALVRRLSIFFGPAFIIDGAAILVTEKRQRASEIFAHTVVLSVPNGPSAMVGWMSLAALVASAALVAYLLFMRFVGIGA